MESYPDDKAYLVTVIATSNPELQSIVGKYDKTMNPDTLYRWEPPNWVPTGFEATAVFDYPQFGQIRAHENNNWILMSVAGTFN